MTAADRYAAAPLHCRAFVGLMLVLAAGCSTTTSANARGTTTSSIVTAPELGAPATTGLPTAATVAGSLPASAEVSGDLPRLGALHKSNCTGFIMTGALFATNSSELVLDAFAVVTEAGRRLLEEPARQVTLIGHTDRQPTSRPGGNDRLSVDRAQAVGDALVAAGVDPARLTVTGVGASQPLDPQASGPAADAQNRRVEVHFGACP